MYAQTANWIQQDVIFVGYWGGLFLLHTLEYSSGKPVITNTLTLSRPTTAPPPQDPICEEELLLKPGWGMHLPQHRLLLTCDSQHGIDLWKFEETDQDKNTLFQAPEYSSTLKIPRHLKSVTAGFAFPAQPNEIWLGHSTGWVSCWNIAGEEWQLIQDFNLRRDQASSHSSLPIPEHYDVRALDAAGPNLLLIAKEDGVLSLIDTQGKTVLAQHPYDVTAPLGNNHLAYHAGWLFISNCPDHHEKSNLYLYHFSTEQDLATQINQLPAHELATWNVHHRGTPYTYANRLLIIGRKNDWIDVYVSTSDGYIWKSKFGSPQNFPPKHWESLQRVTMNEGGAELSLSPDGKWLLAVVDVPQFLAVG
jgi:hypothetical protein